MSLKTHGSQKRNNYVSGAASVCVSAVNIEMELCVFMVISHKCLFSFS